MTLEDYEGPLIVDFTLNVKIVVMTNVTCILILMKTGKDISELFLFFIN